jgi:CubicO group peptidase (beta-lactamase class C family)
MRGTRYAAAAWGVIGAAVLGVLAGAGALSGQGVGGGQPEGAPGSGSECYAPGGLGPAVMERIRRVEGRLRTRVRFTNYELTGMSLRERMARYRVPALSVAVVDRGELAWACAYGHRVAGGDPVSIRTLFHAKSVSKPVSAAVALRLVDTGLLALDEPVGPLLEGWAVPDNEYTRAEAPTLRHILSHTAGFTRSGVDSYEPAEPLPSLLESLAGLPPASTDPLDVVFTPGTEHSYSGGGYGVLQLLLTEQTGRGFDPLVDSLVFRPLGMAHSVFPQPLPDTLGPFAAMGHDAEGRPLPGGFETLPIMAAGGLWTTAADLALFIAALQASWHGNAAFLDHATIREMMTEQNAGWGLGRRARPARGDRGVPTRRLRRRLQGHHHRIPRTGCGPRRPDQQRRRGRPPGRIRAGRCRRIRLARLP